jgi:hypothetical protein
MNDAAAPAAENRRMGPNALHLLAGLVAAEAGVAYEEIEPAPTLGHSVVGTQ